MKYKDLQNEYLRKLIWNTCNIPTSECWGHLHEEVNVMICLGKSLTVRSLFSITELNIINAHCTLWTNLHSNVECRQVPYWCHRIMKRGNRALCSKLVFLRYSFRRSLWHARCILVTKPQICKKNSRLPNVVWLKTLCVRFDVYGSINATKRVCGTNSRRQWRKIINDQSIESPE